MRPTLLIVDDHSGFRSLARRLLTAGGFEVVGEAADGHAAITAARTLQPDVMLVDIQLPDIDGFELTVRRARVHPQGGAVRGRDTLPPGSDRMR